MSYVQNTDADRSEMLERIGVSSFEELLEPIDPRLRLKGKLDLGPPMSEPEVSALIGSLAGKNRPATRLSSFLGGGIYDRYIPAVVGYVLSRSEFYTSYTPYQAEVSQGTLQAIYEYQSLVCRLTGMDAANASMYDGSTALAEAVLMSCGIKRKHKVLIPRAISPATKKVLASYTAGRGILVEEVPFSKTGMMDMEKLEMLCGDETAVVIVAQPNYLGLIEQAVEISKLAHDRGALLIALVDPVSLAVLHPPAHYDADIAVGEGQSMGIPQSCGGPLLGFMATKKAYIRKCPGRLVSATTDAAGERGYVMTLQTREQHIRREKATSNICTNEGLCSLAAAVYLTSLGESGLRDVAIQSMSKSRTLYEMLGNLPGCELPFGTGFFQEFVVDVKAPPGAFRDEARKEGIIPGIPLAGDFSEFGQGALLVAVTEKRSRAELERYAEAVERAGGGK